MRIWLLAGALALAIPAAEAQVNRCVIDGQQTWQSAPCPPGTAHQGSEEASESALSPKAPSADKRPDPTSKPSPGYSLAYRTAQAIERTYLSYQRCRNEAPGGCSQFTDRYIDDLGPLLKEADANKHLLAQDPSALAMLRRHHEDLNEMTTFLKASSNLLERVRELDQ